MPFSGSVSRWIAGVKAGDERAAELLWKRYFDRLIGLAQKKLDGTPRGLVDEEDVALDAFAAFCRAAKLGRFPELSDRHGLWRILLKITTDKAVDQIRHESAQIRGGGLVREELDRQGDLAGFDQIVGDEPTPEFAAMVAENCRRLLSLLEDPVLKAVVLAKLEGYSNQEIATQQDCALRRVERRLQLIRKKWLLALDS
jgi:DNA-directed RNA polymerase specialized sigma24 family protein